MPMGTRVGMVGTYDWVDRSIGRSVSGGTRLSRHVTDRPIDPIVDRPAGQKSLHPLHPRIGPQFSARLTLRLAIELDDVGGEVVLPLLDAAAHAIGVHRHAVVLEGVPVDAYGVGGSV